MSSMLRVSGIHTFYGNVEAEPAVCPLGGRRAAGIDDVELRPVVQPLENVMEEDGVRLSGARPPQDDQVCFLDLLVGAGAASHPEHCRQTDDTGGVSSSVAAIDVVAADHHPRELLDREVQLVGGLGTAKHPKRARSVLVDRRADPSGRPTTGYPGASIQPASHSAPSPRPRTIR